MGVRFTADAVELVRPLNTTRVPWSHIVGFEEGSFEGSYGIYAHMSSRSLGQLGIFSAACAGAPVRLCPSTPAAPATSNRHVALRQVDMYRARGAGHSEGEKTPCKVFLVGGGTRSVAPFGVALYLGWWRS